MWAVHPRYFQPLGMSGMIHSPKRRSSQQYGVHISWTIYQIWFHLRTWKRKDKIGKRQQRRKLINELPTVPTSNSKKNVGISLWNLPHRASTSACAQLLSGKFLSTKTIRVHVSLYIYKFQIIFTYRTECKVSSVSTVWSMTQISQWLVSILSMRFSTLSQTQNLGNKPHAVKDSTAHNWETLCISKWRKNRWGDFSATCALTELTQIKICKSTWAVCTTRSRLTCAMCAEKPSRRNGTSRSTSRWCTSKSR